MKKNIQIILVFLFVLILAKGNIAFDATYEALTFWFNKLVPSLFVEMVLMSLCLRYEVFNLFKPITFFLKGLINMDQSGLNLFFSCLFLGAPAGPVLVNQMVKENRITAQEARRIIYCISLATPSFIVITCGAIFLKSITLGFALWMIQIFICFLFLVVFRVPKIHLEEIKNKDSFFIALKNSITHTGISLFYIGGYLMMVLTILNIITFSLPQISINILKSITEFSLATNMVSQLNLELSLKFILISAILGFNGLCVHLQTNSLVDEVKINYVFYLALRIFQAILSFLIAIIFCTFYF